MIPLKKASILLNIFGVLLLIYSIAAKIKISGFKLLYTDSRWGYIFASTHTLALLIGIGCIIAGVLLLFISKWRKKPGEAKNSIAANSNNSGTSE